MSLCKFSFNITRVRVLPASSDVDPCVRPRGMGAHAILFEETKTDTLKMYPGDLGKNVCGDLGKSKVARFDCEV